MGSGNLQTNPVSSLGSACIVHSASACFRLWLWLCRQPSDICCRKTTTLGSAIPHPKNPPEQIAVSSCDFTRHKITASGIRVVLTNLKRLLKLCRVLQAQRYGITALNVAHKATNVHLMSACSPWHRHNNRIAGGASSYQVHETL